MPIYTYRCENCGVQFDRQQSFSDPPLTRCPECSKKTLRKVYQPVGIVFRGSGFYATDHRSPSGANRSSSGSEKAGKDETPGGASEGKKESERSEAAASTSSDSKESKG
jgi:putative FmdB family regulatory protein